MNNGHACVTTNENTRLTAHYFRPMKLKLVYAKAINNFSTLINIQIHVSTEFNSSENSSKARENVTNFINKASYRKCKSRIFLVEIRQKVYALKVPKFVSILLALVQNEYFMSTGIS